MKSERTTSVERRGGKLYEVLADGTARPHRAPRMDWARFDALADEEVAEATPVDPDNPPLTDAELARMKRVSPVKRLRWKLCLSQAQFAERFQIPVGTLRDWEQHRSEPDQAAKAYLKVIAKDAEFVRRALAAT